MKKLKNLRAVRNRLFGVRGRGHCGLDCGALPRRRGSDGRCGIRAPVYGDFVGQLDKICQALLRGGGLPRLPLRNYRRGADRDFLRRIPRKGGGVPARRRRTPSPAQAVHARAVVRAERYRQGYQGAHARGCADCFLPRRLLPTPPFALPTLRRCKTKNAFFCARRMRKTAPFSTIAGYLPHNLRSSRTSERKSPHYAIVILTSPVSGQKTER